MTSFVSRNVYSFQKLVRMCIYIYIHVSPTNCTSNIFKQESGKSYCQQVYIAYNLSPLWNPWLPCFARLRNKTSVSTPRFFTSLVLALLLRVELSRAAHCLLGCSRVCLHTSAKSHRLNRRQCSRVTTYLRHRIKQRAIVSCFPVLFSCH